MLKIANKKGASEEGGMVIWIVVAIIAAVVVILFFTGGFKIISNLFDQAPQIDVVVQACKLVATPETRLAYCDQWREVEISGDEQMVNCQYPMINSQLDLSAEIECRSRDGSKVLAFKEKAGDECANLFKNGKVTEKTKLNDVVCALQTCEQLGGKPIDKSDAVKCADDEKTMDKLFKEAATNKCCLKK